MFKIKTVFFLIIFQIIFSYMPSFKAYSVSEEISGVLKSGVEWSIDGSVMFFSGTGNIDDMKNYQPYSKYSDTIETIVINEGITSIGYGAFNDFDNLKSVILPESLESIGINAFAYCYNLIYINIPDNVEYIGSGAFYGTYFISRISDSYKIIGDGILYDYDGNDTEIVIPEGVKSISDKVFTSDSSIISVLFPDSVRSIGENAFLECTSLKSVFIPQSVEYFGKNSVGFILAPGPVVDNEFTIYGFESSGAEKYCLENGVAFRKMGDVDADNELTSYDALMILQSAVDVCQQDNEQKIISDMNRDGAVTSYDALLILQYTVNLIGSDN